MAVFRNKNSNIPEIPMNPALHSVEATPKQEFPTQSPPPQPQKPAALPAPDTPPQPSITTPQPAIQAPQPTLATPQPTTMQQSKQPIPSVTPELAADAKSPLEDQPYFVRIDKFRETKEHFESIFMKIQDMEKILETLEIAKEHEDKELDEWKKDIQDMRSLLNNIDKEIFSKI